MGLDQLEISILGENGELFAIEIYLQMTQTPKNWLSV